MKIERACLSVCLVFAVAGLAGCSGSTPLLQAESRVSPLEVKFADPSAEQELVKVGLLSTFKFYWQSHRDRNWSSRFPLENLKQNISEKFYVAYYERAWLLKTVVVRSVTSSTQTAAINIAVTLTNPETNQDAVFETIEAWTLVGDKWMHEVSDPMLSGTKQ
ncbi:MAG: hypothetical protein CFE43_06995 [Burkholderiales bacterium PBB3]|nr:MAG: hypothetical protein CFE43_06995 [Burkholderiales bacterium PBB3]